MPRKSRSNLGKIAKGLQRIIREEMYWGSIRVPKAISDACPAPGMKGTFGGKYQRTKSGAGFEIYTTFPRKIAVYALEFGRRGLPRRERPYPLYMRGKPVIKRRRRAKGVTVEKPSAREEAKFLEEGYIIRYGPIAPQKATFFITRTWDKELRNIKGRIGRRLIELIKRNEL